MNEPMRSLPVTRRSAAEAIALGPVLLAQAERDATPWIVASVVEGPALALGAAQRAGRVVDLDVCGRARLPVLRRSTTGTAAFLGECSLVFSLALPSIASLAPDATPRTLLNRNVRGFLKGFSWAGAVAHYFGREWISLKHRPAALMGFDVTPSGLVLIEVFAGIDASIAVPKSFASADERAVDRFVGKSPCGLAELIGAKAPEELARTIVEGVAGWSGMAVESSSIEGERISTLREIADPRDPVPEGLVLAAPERAPIGWIEAAASPRGGNETRAWLGGDVLAPRWVLDRLAQSAAAGERQLPDLGEIALEGATIAELWRVLVAAVEGAA